MAIDELYCSSWCCWDCDEDSGVLDTIACALVSLGLNPIRENRREGRDGHLWVFFDQPVPATALLSFNQILLRSLQIDPRSVEFFPKSASSWSQVRLPLGVNRKPEAKGARGWFDGPPYEVIDQLRWIQEQPYDSPRPVFRLAKLQESIDQDAKRAQEALRVESNSQFERHESEPINLLQHQSLLTNMKGPRRDNYSAQCPSCAVAGRDQKGRDNLSISAADGSMFKCWVGCSVKEILSALGLWMTLEDWKAACHHW